jgi:hypothetical protein
MSTAMLMVLALQGNSVAKEKMLEQQIQGARENRSPEDTLRPAYLISPTPARSMGSVLDTLTEGERALATA